MENLSGITSERLPYERPALHKHGSVAALTAGAQLPPELDLCQELGGEYCEDPGQNPGLS